MARVLMAAYTNYRRDPRVKREAEALVAAGHQVVMLANRQRGEPNRENIAGVEVLKLPVLSRDRSSTVSYLVNYLGFFLMLSAHLARNAGRYDLVHINNMPDFLVFAAWPQRLLGRPIIHDVHDLMPELYSEKFGQRRWLVGILKLQERWAGKFATQVLTVEERLKGVLSRRGIPAEKIHVLMNLPDERIFAARPAHQAKAPGAPFVLAYHGTLAHRLGLDIAIEAVALLKSRVPNIELRIIGAGEERGRLIALRDKLGLQALVKFSDGFVPVEKIPALIDDADVGLIVLRVSTGTDIMLPTKLLEYVSMGIACVAPRTGTIARYFDDTMLRFFTAEDVQSLADALLSLYQSPARRESLARQATDRFAKKYAWSVHQRVYTDIVDRLLVVSAAARR
jgi:glycosyltransferase involved in cell wall biosynthesis